MNSYNKNAVSYFTIDFAKKAIVGSKSTIAKAGKIGSPQYEALCSIMKIHPTFTIENKVIAKKKDKLNYKNLTFARMEEIIKMSKNSEMMLNKFEAAKKMAKMKNSLYPLTKKWFLDNYPEYKENRIEELALCAELNEIA